MKMFKKLFRLNLFENEPNQRAFSYFIDNDLQRIIPKQIPLNELGFIHMFSCEKSITKFFTFRNKRNYSSTSIEY